MRRREVSRGRRWLAISALLLNVGACIDSSRVNASCAWTDAVNSPLDLTTSNDREHLRQDAQIAWELGVRYGDSIAGVSSLQSSVNRRACRDVLQDTIIARHSVTKAQVREAVLRRVLWIDALAVWLPMVLLTVFVTRFAAQFVRGLHGNVSRTLLFSAPAALIMAGLTQYWAMAVETLRLRNYHLSDRVLTLPNNNHQVLIVGVLYLICVLAVHRASVPTRAR